MEKKSKIGIGLYGTNGHQIGYKLVNHPQAVLVAIVSYNPSFLLPEQKEDPDIMYHSNLEEMLNDPRVELVSLCSPRRKNQIFDAIQCLKAGKHVYAEKPCAMTEDDLDAIIKTATETGKQFHEMAGTAFEQPYLTMRNIVETGVIGEVVQVFAQKSYPYFKERPQDEDIDGGLICQASVHALRYIEHTAGQRIKEIYVMETKLGNPDGRGGLHMAASLIMSLENGGIASVLANYLNPQGFGRWGNEHLRIFGTEGFVEAVDGGTKTRLVVKDKDYGEIDTSIKIKDYFDLFLDSLQGIGNMPFTMEQELHPTRMAIRARKLAIKV